MLWDRARRLLVVDDDEGNRFALAELFREEGFEVREAVDGVHAIETIEGWPPDAVVTDLLMPRMDGKGLITHLRAARPKVPVVVMTANPMLDAERAVHRLGVEGYMHKPLAFGSLLDQLRSLIAAA